MQPVEKYFIAEKWNCLAGVLIGVASVAAALWFLLQVKKPFFSGMAYPLLALGGFFLVICTTVVIRSPKDIERVNGMLRAEPAKIQAEEIPRMEKVMRTFDIIIWAEAAFILAGALLFFFQAPGSLWRGLGAGLSIEAALLLGFDLLARMRGKEYLEFLRSIS